MEGLARNRERVQRRIADACATAGRDPSEVTLVGVTKSVDVPVAAELARLGTLDLGENRVPELERKRAAFAALDVRPRWHFIGHVQRNKARRVLLEADVIHSVDSERLLDTFLRLAEEEPARPALLLQVKLTTEATKGGLEPEALPGAVRRLVDAGTLPFLGLMTMAAPVDPERATERAQARRTFDRLAALAASLPREAFAGTRPELSMGMTGDLEEAVAAGATLVRVGSALFEGLTPATPGPHSHGGRA